jgi:hypothetical protein
MAEGTQLVAEFVAFPLAMLFFAARCFTRIYKSTPGGYAREELVNSTNPHYPFIYLLGEGT